MSFSAVLTLAAAGVATVAMVTEHPRHQSYAALAWLAAGRRGVPIHVGTRVAAVHGGRRVEAVELTTLADGRTTRVPCDTVVFTGDWVPDYELARAGGLACDPGTRGPRVDGALRTSVPGVFAAGNLVHAAEAADVAALGGRHAAAAVHAFLGGAAWRSDRAVPLVGERPLLWVSPHVAVPAARAARRRLLLRVAAPVAAGVLEAEQDGRVLLRCRHRALAPNRSIAAPDGWLAAVDPRGGPVRLTLHARRT